jgi:threo-3-hydroxy-L-aspartate ammonia-lyase
VIDLAEIRAAADRIADEAVVTPILHSERLDALTGATVFAKDESRQRAGAFKFRGAYNRLSQIPESDRPRGVVAVSSGNHGAAVACAAQLLGMPATIHVPEDVPSAKRALIERCGATIVTFERSIADREAGARRQVAVTGATFVHPFEDPMVMAGQGTAALELHEQAGHLDVLLVPMSGGGLMAGCASAMRQLDPDCEPIGVEPAAADDTRRSFAAGEIVRIPQPDTIADGLAVTRPRCHHLRDQPPARRGRGDGHRRAARRRDAYRRRSPRPSSRAEWCRRSGCVARRRHPLPQPQGGNHPVRRQHRRRTLRRPARRLSCSGTELLGD